MIERLIAQTVRIGNRTTIERNHEALHRYLSGRLIDVDLGDHRAVSVVALVEHARDAAARRLTGPAEVRLRRRHRT